MATKTKPKRVTPAQFGRITKLHKLLALALKDVRAAEKRRNTRIEMWNYLIRDNGECCVCAAGAVMLCEFQVRGDDVTPDSFDAPVRDRLRAIDQLRSGHVGRALDFLNGRGWFWTRPHKLDRSVTFYHGDDCRGDPSTAAQWHADMKQLLADLKAANL